MQSNKVKNILSKEKELAQSSGISNQGVLESFREKFIDTPNFSGVQCLMSICKKKQKKNQCNSSSNSSSSSSASSTPILNTSANTHSDSLHINFSDLNDKLFLCFLSNFSCKLVENFLANTTVNTTPNTSLISTNSGFIRKHKFDKSFSYVNLVNENDAKMSNFKLCLKLDKWPSGYDFSKRIKILNSDRTLSYLISNTCLITLNYDDLETSFEDEEEDLKWTVDTRLAETVIFKSMTKFRLFLFYFLHFVLNNLNSIVEGRLSSSSSSTAGIKVHNRVLLHHYLRYFDLNHQTIREDLISNLDQLSKFYVNFSSYLRTQVLSKHNSLNKPNYFNLNSDICVSSDPSCELDTLDSLLVKSEQYFKKPARADFGKLQCTYLSRPRETNRLFNQYLIDFFQILFEQFKSKRDHFKINEQVLIEIHEEVIRSNENLNYIFYENTDNDIDVSGGLLSKFEMYAECVHKYLPQIRQHNQYLLFHYIWTMQVQYLAPFFNYICDLYKAYD